MLLLTSIVTACSLLSVTSAASWSKRPGNIGSAFIGVSAGAKPEETYFAGGDNGIGAAVLKSEDHGSNYTQLTIEKYTGLLLAAGASRTKAGSAVVNGLFISQYTTDGETFKYSLGGGGGQTVVPLSDNGYAIVSGNNVKISKNGGVSFKKYPLSGGNFTQFPARYGAFPSATTWYISAGTWPSSSAPATVKMVTERHGVELETGKPFFNFENNNNEIAAAEYQGAIFKTTDGGKTYTQVFTIPPGTAYFNQISCSSESHCVAVAEGHNSQHPGSYIYATTDAGKTWKLTHQGVQGCGMTGVYMLDEKEVWAMGARPHGIFGQADILHSTDGGATWTETNIDGVAGLFLDCFDNTSCYASAINLAQQSTLLIYK